MNGLLFIVILTIVSLNSLAQTKKDSLYVFVGKKISVDRFYVKSEPNQIIMNHSFRAKYKVIQNVFGNYNKDTIEFEAFDHYGIPAFSIFDYVLLYVSNYNGKLYHEKYQYNDVYKTKNGRWASSFQADDYGHDYNKNTLIKPEPIEFADSVIYKLKNLTKEDITELYPSPYFQIANGRAIARWGNYVEELFLLKRNSVLKARGIFE